MDSGINHDEALVKERINILKFCFDDIRNFCFDIKDRFGNRKIFSFKDNLHNTLCSKSKFYPDQLIRDGIIHAYFSVLYEHNNSNTEQIRILARNSTPFILEYLDDFNLLLRTSSGSTPLIHQGLSSCKRCFNPFTNSLIPINNLCMDKISDKGCEKYHKRDFIKKYNIKVHDLVDLLENNYKKLCTVDKNTTKELINIIIRDFQDIEAGMRTMAERFVDKILKEKKFYKEEFNPLAKMSFMAGIKNSNFVFASNFCYPSRPYATDKEYVEGNIKYEDLTGYEKINHDRKDLWLFANKVKENKFRYIEYTGGFGLEVVKD